MKIELLTAYAKGGETILAGEIISLNNTHANELIKNGYAKELEPVCSEPKAQPPVEDNEPEQVETCEEESEQQSEHEELEEDEGEPQPIPLGRSNKKSTK